MYQTYPYHLDAMLISKLSKVRTAVQPSFTLVIEESLSHYKTRADIFGAVKIEMTAHSSKETTVVPIRDFLKLPSFLRYLFLMSLQGGAELAYYKCHWKGDVYHAEE